MIKNIEHSLDKYWEKIKNIHSKTPYWKEKSQKIGISIKEFKKLEDFLNHPISLCEENELKERPLEYFMPEEIIRRKKDDIHICTSSGSTGKKKNAPWSNEAIDYNSEYLSELLDMYNIPKDLNFLILGPSYPAPFQLIMEKLAKKRNGFIYFAPVEMREIKKYLDSVDFSKYSFDDLLNDAFFKARISPAIEYQLDILEKEKISVLGSTPFLLPFFAKCKGFENVKLIYFGGMEIPSEQYKLWKEDLSKMDKKLITSYGHYMFGLIFNTPNEELTYFSPSPLSSLYVVKEDNPFDSVEYNENGKVRFLRMDSTLLWSQVERDYATRVQSNISSIKWDGVKNITTKY